MGSSGLGRPRKFEKPLYFGMKVTPDEKAAIKKLAQIAKKPASQTIMSLVHAALENHAPTAPLRRINTAELRALSPTAQQKLLQIQAQAIACHHEVLEYNEDIVDE